jgi:hypothetical protein
MDAGFRAPRNCSLNPKEKTNSSMEKIMSSGIIKVNQMKEGEGRDM